MFQIIGGNEKAEIKIENCREKEGILYFDISMKMPEPEIPQMFSVKWQEPVVDCYSVWSPSGFTDGHMATNWAPRRTYSRIASWMPVHMLMSAKGMNRMTVAVSDALNPMTISTGTIEESACADCTIDFFTNLTSAIKEYKATVRIDRRDINYYDSLYDVTKWWEEDCGYKPAYVPEYAKMPMNSLWYSYHQQLDIEDILKECRLSKALGMETVIVDDGWQTDDNGRGYAYCGDWEPAKSKIPDMKKFVADVHDTGMKIMIWYSVPFIGIYSKNYERFKDMLLDQTGDAFVKAIDPRYKEARDFIINTYSRAVKEWGLDGLKLDFIDSFCLHGRSLEPDPRRDFTSLEEAVDRLMVDVADTLRKINPEILIEFRQSYVGPAIRKYGNMLRVMDCPNDSLENRFFSVALRMTSGQTAVHSDMLMWNVNDTVESAAMQFASVMYAVPQISMKIDKLPESHKKMLAFYLSFWRKNRDVLMNGTIIASNPESCYSIVSAEKDGKAVVTVYTQNVVSTVYDEVSVVNASKNDEIIFKGYNGRRYDVYDCMGNLLESGIINEKIDAVKVPMCGIIIIK